MVANQRSTPKKRCPVHDGRSKALGDFAVVSLYRQPFASGTFEGRRPPIPPRKDSSEPCPLKHLYCTLLNVTWTTLWGLRHCMPPLSTRVVTRLCTLHTGIFATTAWATIIHYQMRKTLNLASQHHVM